MLSLDQIKQQLTELAEGQDKLMQSHAALALDLQNARQELAVMRQSTLGLLIEEVRKLDAKIMATGNGLADELGYIRLGIANLFAKVCQAKAQKNRASYKPRTRRGGPKQKFPAPRRKKGE